MTTLGHGPDALLAHGEDILWQGQPGRGIILREVLSRGFFMGAVFTGFSIFWISKARRMAPADEPLFALLFPLAGVPFLLIGLWMLIGRHVWDAWMRAGTHYTLTNRQAYIAKHMLGQRSLETWPLEDIDGVELIDGHPGSVLFQVSMAARMQHGRPAPIKTPFGGTRAPLGFRQIEDPRRVHRLITEAQDRLRAEIS